MSAGGTTTKLVPATLVLDPPVKEKKSSKAKIDNKGFPNTPVDFSFQDIKSLAEISENEPNKLKAMRRVLNSHFKRNKQPLLPKGCKKFPVTAVKLCYNNLTSIKDLDKALATVLERPEDLTWIDLSYNQLTSIDSVLAKFPNLQMLYLHGNSIRDLRDVKRLRGLQKLKKLTLHGNKNVIDKGTRFLKMVKPCIKPTKAETTRELRKLPKSRIKEQCALLKKFDIDYIDGKVDRTVASITGFIFADETNRFYRPTADSNTSAEDKKIIQLENTRSYREKVVSYLPSLTDLDFIGVTPLERSRASRIKPA